MASFLERPQRQFHRGLDHSRASPSLRALVTPSTLRRGKDFLSHFALGGRIACDGNEFGWEVWSGLELWLQFTERRRDGTERLVSDDQRAIDGLGARGGSKRRPCLCSTIEEYVENFESVVSSYKNLEIDR